MSPPRLNMDRPFKPEDLEPIEEETITLKPEPMTTERFMLLRTNPKYMRIGAVRECVQEINWLVERIHALEAEVERLRSRNPLKDAFITTKGNQ